MSSIRTAVVGVGNCCSSLVQGATYYRANPDETCGLIRPEIADWKPGDIEFVAAYDVDKRKVGLPLGEAIFAGENNTRVFADAKRVSEEHRVEVLPGPRMDGVGRTYAKVLGDTEDNRGTREATADNLREARAEVLVNFLPVGSEGASKWWAEVAILARCAMVNAIPVFLASGGEYAEKFTTAGLPIIGDDIKSQFGATLLHRLIMGGMKDRGYEPDDTYQLNFGGNMDFRNMIDGERLGSKLESKTRSIEAVTNGQLGRDRIHVSPSDTVRFLQDQKIAYINANARGFGGSPLELECKIKVWDSPNSAGCVTDCVRLARLALDRGHAGPVMSACASYCKSPPEDMPDAEANKILDDWLETATEAGVVNGHMRVLEGAE